MSQKENRDLGLGVKSGPVAARGLNKDGSFNVERTGISRFSTSEVYHSLISMSWGKFGALLLTFYVADNIIFAFLYMMAGPENFTGVGGQTWFEQFLDMFFFSSQTVTTLGYGRTAPVGTLASTIAAIESMIGLLGFALVTGLLYARVSRPDAKILFSKNGVIAPYRDGKAFMFRMVNKRSNQLIEVEAEVVVSMTDKKSGNRIFEAMPLERSKINFFPMNWTVVHPIDEKSPLWGITKEELANSDIEFIILLKGFDDTFSQTIYSRTSYFREEILWGKKFTGMLSVGANGKRVMDISKLDDMEEAPLPEEKREAKNMEHA